MNNQDPLDDFIGNFEVINNSHIQASITKSLLGRNLWPDSTRCMGI